MTMKQNVIAAVTQQIQNEQSNAHTYHNVALYFEKMNLRGFAAWKNKQSADERGHADKFIAHLINRGVAVALGALPAPPATFASPLDAVQATLELEERTTVAIHKLYELAKQENDCALEVLLHWFINEQVEEEQSATELVEWMTHLHKSPGSLYMFDHRWRRMAEKE